MTAALRRPWLRVACIFAAVIACSAQVDAQAPAPQAPATTSAYVEADARPPAPPDVEPVYRGPTVDTLATIRKRGALRVGVAINEPAVMHDADGALVGLSIDVATRLADDMGVRVELVETSWSSIIPDLVNRQFDVTVSGLWVTIPRALVVNYSSPTAVEGIYVIASRAAAARLKVPADLDRAGTKIVVYAGTLQERLAARRSPQATQLSRPPSVTTELNCAPSAEGPDWSVRDEDWNDHRQPARRRLRHDARRRCAARHGHARVRVRQLVECAAYRSRRAPRQRARTSRFPRAPR